MDEEQFNMEIRKFLKRFGVGAQREIERAVQQGIESGALAGRAAVKVRARLEVEGVEGEFVVEDELRPPEDPEEGALVPAEPLLGERGGLRHR